MALRLYNDKEEMYLTISGGSLTFPATKGMTFTENSNDGHIGQFIRFKSTFDVDRPWMMWISETNRNMVGFGYHTKDAVSGEIHKALEVKTVALLGGPNPADMRTRLSIGTDAQRITASFTYTDAFEVYQGENPFTVGEGAVAPFGLQLRAVPQDTVAAGASNYIGGNMIMQLDASDNATMFIDVKPAYGSGGSLFPGNKSANLVFFRNVNLPSATNPQMNIKKGDGTNTDAVTIVAKTGTVTMIGPLGINGSSAPAKPTVSGAKGSNAALASLLTALVSYGFITDSTSA